jgi:hypothetical protein
MVTAILNLETVTVTKRLVPYNEPFVIMRIVFRVESKTGPSRKFYNKRPSRGKFMRRIDCLENASLTLIQGRNQSIEEKIKHFRIFMRKQSIYRGICIYICVGVPNIKLAKYLVI